MTIHIKHVPYGNKIPVMIIDPNYTTHAHLYSGLLADPKYSVMKHKNIKQVFADENFLPSYKLIIITPHMASYGHYDDGCNKTENGKLTGLFLYRDKFEGREDLKVIVWARTTSEALEHWGDNVVRREIIPKKHHFCFHEAAEELFK